MELALLVQYTAGFILLGSAAAKVWNPQAFVEAFRRFRMVPPRFVTTAASFLILAESLLAVALVVGITAAIALPLASALFAAFAVVNARYWRRDQGQDCGCLGGVVKLRLGLVSLATNATVSLGTAAAAGWFVASNRAINVPVTQAAALRLTAFLLACVYWLASYAQTVIGTMQEASQSEAP